MFVMQARDRLALEVNNLSFFYPVKGKNIASPTVESISLPIVANAVTAIIGPSGCGKSTLLRCLNRMNDTVGERGSGKIRYEGNIFLKGGEDILDVNADVQSLRKRIGMVFQQPNPFLKSIFENVAWGLRIHGLAHTVHDFQDAVEKNLRRVELWDEVKTRLQADATTLSGGQQQRLCMARVIALEPEILLMDEPCGSLDPPSTAKIENLIKDELRGKYTIVVVTHSLAQAGRIADFVAYMEAGKLIEYGPADEVLQNPRDKKTERFVRGLIG